jgi:hypothetical protein
MCLKSQIFEKDDNIYCTVKIQETKTVCPESQFVGENDNMYGAAKIKIKFKVPSR